MRYWLELMLVVGLYGRFVADLFAGTFAGMIVDGQPGGSLDGEKFETGGLTLQNQPLFWHDDLPSEAYYLYAVFAVYWARIFYAGFFETLASPGLVFGAIGVPPVVMEMVAYANVLVMFYFAGLYLAKGVYGSFEARDTPLRGAWDVVACRL